MSVDKLFEKAAKQKNLLLKTGFPIHTYKLPSNVTLKDFLIQFFTKLNKTHETYLVRGRRICTSGRNRTITDTYGLARHYFPRLPFKRFLLTFIEVALEHHIHTFVCADIDKRIWYDAALEPGTISYRIDYDYQYGDEDEFGLTRKDYVNWYNENKS